MVYSGHRRVETTTAFATRIAAFFDLLTVSGVLVLYSILTFNLLGKYINDTYVLLGWLFVGVCVALAPLLSGLLLVSTSSNRSAKFALVIASMWIVHRTTCYILLVIPVINLRVLSGFLGLSTYYSCLIIVVTGYIWDLLRPRQPLKEFVALLSLP